MKATHQRARTLMDMMEDGQKKRRAYLRKADREEVD